MADVDHPKTHVEDQEDAKLPRTQPESPKHEGIDPLTESDTMYPAENTKELSEKAARGEAKAEPQQAPEATQADQANPGVQGDVVSESADNLAQADRADSESLNANADGKLPKDAKVANHKSSDRQNTSPSNKPATTDEPHDGSGATDGEPTRGTDAAKKSTRASSKR